VRAAARGTHLDVGLGLLAPASPVFRWISKDVPLSGLWGRGQRFAAGHRSLLPGVAAARTHYLVLTRSLGVFTRSLCCHDSVLSGAWSRCSAGCFRAPMLRHQRRKLRSWFLSQDHGPTPARKARGGAFLHLTASHPKPEKSDEHAVKPQHIGVSRQNASYMWKLGACSGSPTEVTASGGHALTLVIR